MHLSEIGSRNKIISLGLLFFMVCVLPVPTIAKAWSPTSSASSVSFFSNCSSVRGTRVNFDQEGNQYFARNDCYGDVDPGPKTISSRGGNAVFKLDKLGNLVWKITIGFGETVGIASIAVNPDGSSYVVGSFQQSSAFNYAVDFDPGPGTYMLPNFGGVDGFLLKLDPAGRFLWAIRLGGLGFDYASAVMRGDSGNLYVIGQTDSGIDDIDPGSGQFQVPKTIGGSTSFLIKMTSDGLFQWVRTFAGISFLGEFSTQPDSAITLDSNENVFLTSSYSPSFNWLIDFDPGQGVIRPERPSNFPDSQSDFFIIKLSNSGIFQWVKQLGGLGNDFGSSIVASKDGSIIVTGGFSGVVDFDSGPGVNEVTAKSDQTPRKPTDGFVLKLDLEGNFLWVQTFGSYKDDAGFHLATDSSSNVYVVGGFNVEVDLGFKSMPVNFSAISNPNSRYSGSFILKLNSEGRYLWADSRNSWDAKSRIGQGFSNVSVDSQDNLRLFGIATGRAIFRSPNGQIKIELGQDPKMFVLKIDPMGIPFSSGAETAPYLSTKKSAAAKSIALYAGLKVPRNSKLTLKLNSASTRFCRLSGASVRGVKRGPCKVAITVTPRTGRSIVKTVLLEVQ